MITGKKSEHHGAMCHNDIIRNNECTLGDVLHNEGYRTCFVGKPHFGSQQHSGSIESIADWRDGLRKGFTGPYAGFEQVQMILGHSNPLVCPSLANQSSRMPEKKIMEKDKQALVDKRNADHYGQHIMRYQKWKPEYDALGIKCKIKA